MTDRTAHAPAGSLTDQLRSSADAHGDAGGTERRRAANAIERAQRDLAHANEIIERVLDIAHRDPRDAAEHLLRIRDLVAGNLSTPSSDVANAATQPRAWSDVRSDAATAKRVSIAADAEISEAMVGDAARAVRGQDTLDPADSARLLRGWDQGLTDPETAARCRRAGHAALIAGLTRETQSGASENGGA